MSYAHTQVAQIAAISRNRCIGKDNQLPWHIREDLQHFKRLTTAHDISCDTQGDEQNHAQGDEQSKVQGIVIMGRKTFESMGSKPLPKRVNFVITTQLDYAEAHGLTDQPRVHVLHNLDDALTQAASLAHGLGLDTLWVIGGEQVFAQAMRFTDRVELTHVDTDIDAGDAFYPELPSDFVEVSRSQSHTDANSGLAYCFVSYGRGLD